MGTVGGAFSIAAVLGVPIGLKLAEIGGWRMPFFAVAALGLVTVFGVMRVMRPHARPPDRTCRRSICGSGSNFSVSLVRRKTTLIAYATTSLMLAGSFLLVPNISTYRAIQSRLSARPACLALRAGRQPAPFSRSALSANWSTGSAARKVGFVTCAHPYACIDLSRCMSTICRAYCRYLALFAAYITINSARYVATSTAISKVPAPNERAGFMSLNAAVQNLGSSTAAISCHP